MSFMTRTILGLTASLFLAIGLTSCSRTAQQPANQSFTSGQSPAPAKISSESVVTATAAPVTVPAGGSAQATVKVTVQKGYHVNANPPTYPYLKATELELPDSDDLSVDYIYYPNPLSKKFSFAEKPLLVYEGETPVTVSLNATPTAKKGERSISATLRIQACDDQVCYPPGSISVALPVTIK